MSTIVDDAVGLLPAELRDRLALATGTEGEAVQRTLDAALPLILGAAASRAADPIVPPRLHRMVTDPVVADAGATPLASVLDAPAPEHDAHSLRAHAAEFAHLVFGASVQGVSNALGRLAVAPGSGELLLEAACALALVALGRRVAGARLDPTHLAEFLDAERGAIIARIPPRLAAFADGGVPIGLRPTPPARRPRAVPSWLVPGVVLAGLSIGGWWYARTRPAEVVAPQAPLVSERDTVATDTARTGGRLR